MGLLQAWHGMACLAKTNPICHHAFATRVRRACVRVCVCAKDRARTHAHARSEPSCQHAACTYILVACNQKNNTRYSTQQHCHQPRLLLARSLVRKQDESLLSLARARHSPVSGLRPPLLSSTVVPPSPLTPPSAGTARGPWGSAYTEHAVGAAKSTRLG